ncbi:PAS domain-containing sensor histidine kinase [Bremerella cremea]|uniref:histidine kinase n=1 Tax=Bremerella cremea TaxID=1031537 RepID=A0A368KMF1_9BACT|nr:PAS domain-containing sensor histidine kinase [Bremerella cremea]RCS43231.1 PAS domain-containing sensor histidine kinase [Bremerella cremea]
MTQNEGQYKIDLEICPMPILLVASSGKIVRTNKRLEVLFGYAANELIGQTVEVLVPPEFREDHPDLRDAYFEVPTNRRMGTGRDLNGMRKDGTKIPVEIGLDPLEFDGEMMVMVSILDISERKKNEAMIRRALNAASSAMIQVGENGTIELVNESATLMFGYETNDLLGEPIEILVPERFRRKHTVYRTSYQSNRSTRNMGGGRELFGVRKDGSEFPVEIGLTPILESHGKSTMATIIDVTDRVAKERFIEAKSKQLESLNQDLVQFAYSASHDLKAPLASIAGLLGYAEADLKAGDLEEVQCNLTRSRELADRLAKRIEDMLQLARSDMMNGDWVEIDIDARIQAAWSSLPTDHTKLTTDYQHEDRFWSIPVRFDAIIENLMSNAIKYRDQARKNCLVNVRTWSEQDHFYLSIADNGIGIPKKHRERVFSLFQRISDTDQPGSGLGLAITKKNVTQLGGTIVLEDDGGVTRFTVMLPQGHIQNLTKGGCIE